MHVRYTISNNKKPVPFRKYEPYMFCLTKYQQSIQENLRLNLVTFIDNTGFDDLKGIMDCDLRDKIDEMNSVFDASKYSIETVTVEFRFEDPDNISIDDLHDVYFEISDVLTEFSSGYIRNLAIVSHFFQKDKVGGFRKPHIHIIYECDDSVKNELPVILRKKLST